MKKLITIVFLLLVCNLYSQKSSEILPVLNVDAGIMPSNVVFVIDGTNYWGKTSASNLVFPISQITNLQTTLDSKYPLVGNPNNYINQTDARTAISMTNTGFGSATYNNITGIFNIPTPKLSTPYSGVTNGSGNYTIVFGSTYSVAPNIQVCLINPNVRDTPIVTVSTTGFTVNIQRRTDLVGLLPTYANVVGGAIDVLITEK